MADLIDREVLKERFRLRINWLKKDVHDQYSLGLYHGCETDAALVDEVSTFDPESLRPTGEWISVEDRLPEENEYVMIWCGQCQIARIEKGISEEQRKAMKRGELDDPCETGWTLSSGYFTLKRSQSYKACDEQGNNRVPYCWYANGGPMQWFGQDVTHWMPLPEPPNCGAKMKEAT